MPGQYWGFLPHGYGLSSILLLFGALETAVSDSQTMLGFPYYTVPGFISVRMQASFPFVLATQMQ